MAFFCLIIGFPASGQQLVQNGGFETGDFTGWTLSGNTEYTTVSTRYVHSGSYGASLGPSNTLGYISQTLSTSPGQRYALSLWLENPSGQQPTEFQVLWNGTVI
ncbi:MAG TPA: carbohydrate binding domain-containing protein, partial [Verrucomicrobiae bacterium]